MLSSIEHVFYPLMVLPCAFTSVSIMHSSSLSLFQEEIVLPFVGPSRNLPASPEHPASAMTSSLHVQLPKQLTADLQAFPAYLNVSPALPQSPADRVLEDRESAQVTISTLFLAWSVQRSHTLRCYSRTQVLLFKLMDTGYCLSVPKEFFPCLIQFLENMLTGCMSCLLLCLLLRA